MVVKGAAHWLTEERPAETMSAFTQFLSEDRRLVLTLDLRAHGVRRLFVCGLATDDGVKATALDAKAPGFASAAVTVCPNNEESALEELRRAGVRIADSAEAGT